MSIESIQVVPDVSAVLSLKKKSSASEEVSYISYCLEKELMFGLCSLSRHG